VSTSFGKVPPVTAASMPPAARMARARVRIAAVRPLSVGAWLI
jgi:hypothetical protein